MRIFVLMALVAALGGCNTVAGVGQDISGAAHAVQNSL
ncbi:entericidin A/B family lipoprotein [Solirhodobacter olei]|jgi:predicted small secreted protein|nr:entericidin A/B family lipoprotein [Solirhodobacter olei]